MNALGMIETNSIPAGIEAGDAMLKAADVSLVTAQAVCAGKYIVVISGDVAGVQSAQAAGTETAGLSLVDSVVIPHVHTQVIAAISASTEISVMGALGILEFYSLSSAVVCADAAVKAADVSLIEVRLGRGLGGKSFVIMTGEVAAVKASVEAARALEEAQGFLAGFAVIPSPHPDIVQAIL